MSTTPHPGVPPLDYQPNQPRKSRWPYWLSLIVLVAAVAIGFISFNLPHGGSRPTNNLAKCQNNLRQIGQAILVYASNHGGQFPDSFQTLDVNQSLLSTAVFVCSESNDEPAYGNTPAEVAADMNQPGHVSYVYLGSGLNTATVKPDQVVVYEHPENHNGVGMNLLFGDGHAEWFELKRANELIAKAIAATQPTITSQP